MYVSLPCWSHCCAPHPPYSNILNRLSFSFFPADALRHHLTAPPIASPVATSLNSSAFTLAYPLHLRAIISSASPSLTAHNAKTRRGDINTRTYDTLMERTGTDNLGRTILLLITGPPSARHGARTSTDTDLQTCVCAPLCDVCVCIFRVCRCANLKEMMDRCQQQVSSHSLPLFTLCVGWIGVSAEVLVYFVRSPLNTCSLAHYE